MKKYCFEAKKVNEVTTKVIVCANSLKEAENLLEKAWDNNEIDFSDSIDEEEDFVYEIDEYSCLEDDSFDEENCSDEGLQVIKDERITTEEYDLLVMEYAQKYDKEYGNCNTCKHYGKCNTCSYCDEGSEYDFDLINYQKLHEKEIKEYLKNKK